MTVGGIRDYLKQHWPAIREQLRSGTYEPKPVRRVEIPKPDGGVRKLGIPTVLDRFIQQAVMQGLQRRWDRTFSDGSYGFRPGRSAHQAVAQAQQYIADGYGWCVDFDLEKFFDRVNHDKLMGQVAKRVQEQAATLGPAAAPGRSVAAVENTPPSPGCPAGAGGFSAARAQHGGQRPLPVVSGSVPSPHEGTQQCLFSVARTSIVDRGALAQPARIAVYGRTHGGVAGVGG
jgi:hypothetical protein